MDSKGLTVEQQDLLQEARVKGMLPQLTPHKVVERKWREECAEHRTPFVKVKRNGAFRNVTIVLSDTDYRVSPEAEEAVEGAFVEHAAIRSKLIVETEQINVYDYPAEHAESLAYELVGIVWLFAE